MLRKIAGAIRVVSGRNSVEPNLAASLQTRNHMLDDFFSARKIVIEEKKKKSTDVDDESEDSEEEEDHLDGDNGCHYVERVGVRYLVIIYLIITIIHFRFFVKIQVNLFWKSWLIVG